MASSEVRAVLRLAAQRGMLPAEEVASLDAELSSTSGNLDGRSWLLARGLSAAQLKELERALGLEETADVTDVTQSGEQSGGVDPRILADWERYADLRYLAGGGGGNVYVAFDRSLHRKLALKFLRDADVQGAARFLDEARAQARVRHPNVCEVYEVGELGGVPYIAMQLIEGRTLHDAARGRPLDVRVRLVRDVAEALHAAHESGLVHRDVKPSNVLVEETDQGPRPFVTDFGLARDIAADQTHTVVGTPAYMAPEQTLSDAIVDRRADVFALGVTLYELVTGLRPFTGGSVLEVLHSVVHVDPVPPRRLAPDLPVDIESVILRCLAKSPEERYQTARALADDLDRFLAGEPVLARRAGVFSAMRRGLRRHRRGATVAVALAAVAAVLVAVVVAERHGADRRARGAQALTRELAELSSALRTARLLPTHDIRPEEARIRARLTELARRGGAIDAYGHYALGRGYLLLREYDAAAVQLQAAWDGGYREADEAVALGEALGALYERAVSSARAAESQKEHTARLGDAQKLRDQALDLLRQGGQGDWQTPAYVEGLIALYEGRSDDAVAAARRARADVPGLYEADVLEGDAAVQRGRSERDRGDRAASGASFDAADRAFTRASEAARSDEEVFEHRCALASERIALADRGERTHDERAAVTQFVEAGRGACSVSTTINPDDAAAWLRLALLEEVDASWRADAGMDPSAGLDRAAVAVAHAGASGGSAHLAGRIEVARARWLGGHGGDPRPPLDRAIEKLEEARQLDAGEEAIYQDLGSALRRRGDAEDASGGDPRDWLRRAIATCDEVVARFPEKKIDAVANRGLAYASLAEYEEEHHLDASASLAAALSSFDDAIAADGNDWRLYADRGQAYLVAVEAALAAERDPDELVEKGLADERRAAGLAPDVVTPYGNWVTLELFRAQWQIDHGGDPGAAVRDGEDAGRRLVGLDDTSDEAHRLLAELHIVAARWAARHKRADEAEGEFARAADELGHVAPADDDGQLSRAELHRRRAEWLVAQHRDARAEIAATQAALAAAKNVDAGDPRPARIRAALASLALSK